MTTHAKPPDHLSDEAKDRWNGIVADWELDDAAKLLLLQVALEALDKMRYCRKLIHADGQVVYSATGRPMQHPLLAVERDHRSAMLTALRMLKLTDDDAEKIGRPTESSRRQKAGLVQARKAAPR